MSGTVTLNTIFQHAGAAYRVQHGLPFFQRKAMQAIEACRTPALGGHVDQCDHCGYKRVHYNSCRNRHCPNCQGLARKKWVHAREQELLPILYFHVVFTLPDELRTITLINQRIMYSLLFQAASETLLQLGRDERHLGGQIGIIAVLHTWGQAMTDHPHLHCIVTGGGISNDGSRWATAKQTTPKRDYFIHVNVISDLFKKKFLDYLKHEYRAGTLTWVGQIRPLHEKKAFQHVLDQLYVKKWVTYCKRPFAGPKQVIGYLGHYTHRVAISNQRIKSYENGSVTFRWKDYRDGQKTKLMTLTVDEFIRRFLLHVLPANFYRIRYYGLLANRDRVSKLARCREFLGVIAALESLARKRKPFDALLLELCGVDVWCCPKCQTGRMIRITTVERITGLPP
jgi:hypothetical protein